MTMTIPTSLAMATLLLLANPVRAFLPLQVKPSSSSTVLYLEDHIANMIDQELYRQQHHSEYEQAWMEKNREAVLHSLHGPQNNDNALPSSMLDDNSMYTDRQAAKDRYLAKRDPQRYCADRCIATGNCDVYEDIFEFSPEQVLEFCEECVLFDDELNDEASCDIPDVFFSR
mmetsp:Transcript_18352/g.37910  ORF Transcript_18352/g.37910 Transcript_18352/m.37910 type:complete len:172 (-) Transcript_18352:1-516(-)